MKTRISELIIPTVRATAAAIGCGMLLATTCAAAQNPSLEHGGVHHKHYKVVFTKTFGGPNGHIFIGGAHVLNNSGTLIGSADTSMPDPYAPDGCFNGDDCFATHAFAWHDGEMKDLGAIASYANSETTWISPDGLISGNAQNGHVDPNTGWEMHGVLWKRGQLIDLGTLDGGPLSVTSAVNSAGEVVGLSLNLIQDPYSMWGFYQTRAFRWKDGTMIDLGTLGGPDAVAIRINDRGQIAGNSYLSVNPSSVCGIATGAFLWEKGKMINLDSLGGTCSFVNDLTESGDAVGASYLPGDLTYRPVLWRDGHMIDLSTIDGKNGAAVAANDAGEIVGYQMSPDDDALFHTVVWSGGRILDLKALGVDQKSFPNAINNKGQVVGISGNRSFDEVSLRAVISERGEPWVDLNTLILPNLGVQLRNATYINDRGEIAAIGAFPDGNHAPVLLVPSDDER